MPLWSLRSTGVRPRSTPRSRGRFLSFEELEFIANGVRDEWTMPAIAPRLDPAAPILIREFEQHSYSVVLARITGPSVLPVSQSQPKIS